MNGLKRIIGEIHRRSLWQVLGVYVAGAWVALQVVNEVVDSVALPDWISGAAVVLLVVGFPIVLGTAFVQEGVGRERPEADARQVGERPDSAAAAGVASAVPQRTAPAAADARGAHHRWFTWRNAVLGGVGAFAILGLATAGYIAMRSLGVGPAATLVAKGVLSERDRILLVDFTNRTSDSLLAGVVTEALRVDLAQSNTVRLAEQSLVTAALDRMERPTNTPVDVSLARLLAQREGIKAVLAGEIGAAGSSYVLTAQLLEPVDGAVLFSHRETAAGPDEVIDAINSLSRRLRERIGESLGSIRAALPLERVTTSNLEALRLYTQAVRAIEFDGDDERGLSLLDEAVALDTAFAAAYRKIGVTLGNRFEQRDRLVTALTKAYRHRDRLTPSERYMTAAAYHSDVTGDVQQAVTAYENLLESDPTYYPALNNLGIMYYGLRDPQRAEELYVRAAAVDQSSPFPILNTVWAQLSLGKVDAVRATLDTLDARFPGYPSSWEYRAKVEALVGDYEAARDELGRLLEVRAGDLFYRGVAQELLGTVAATRGELARAETHLQQAVSANETRGLPGAHLRGTRALAWMDLDVRRDTAGAARRLARALDREPLDALPPQDRPYLELVEIYAVMGRLERAKSLLAEYEAAIPREYRGRRGPQSVPNYLRSQAAIAIEEGRVDEALELIRRSDEGGCLVCPLPLYAHAYERAGMPDSAIAVYERYVNLQWLDRIYWDNALLARYLERLGVLYEARQDLEKAAEYYARFVELWDEADEELQPRVRAAQARLQEIARARG